MHQVNQNQTYRPNPSKTQEQAASWAVAIKV